MVVVLRIDSRRRVDLLPSNLFLCTLRWVRLPLGGEERKREGEKRELVKVVGKYIIKKNFENEL